MLESRSKMVFGTAIFSLLAKKSVAVCGGGSRATNDFLYDSNLTKRAVKQELARDV
jgi:hypothetical protein